MIGYSTRLTQEAGACSVRLKLPGLVEEGNLAVALRHAKGWLPGLGNTKRLKSSMGLEVVVMGRANLGFSQLTYLPEQTLMELWPLGSSTEVKASRAAI